MVGMGVRDRDEAVVALTDLAGTYADQIITSMPLPPQDPILLKKGLTGAFLCFLSDAVAVLTDHE